MTEAVQEATERDLKVRARQNLTYLLIFAIVMFFAALSSAYVVSKSSTDYWLSFRIPAAFYYSTAIIVASSLTVQMALITVRKGNGRGAALWLAITLALGIAFSYSQFSGWTELVARKMSLVTDKITMTKGVYGVDYTVARRGVTLDEVDGQFYLPTDLARAKPLNAEMADFWNAASGYFYVLTVGHWAHLLGGLLVLAILSIKTFMGRYNAAYHTGVWQGTIYWHFLGGLWVYLLLFLALVH
jgi:cytochrome c oxidase subunit 3